MYQKDKKSSNMWTVFLSLFTGCQTSNDTVNSHQNQYHNEKKKYDDENEIVTLDLTVKPNNNTIGIRKNINIPLIAVVDNNSPISNKGNDSSINDDLLLFLSNVNVEKDNHTMVYKYHYKTNTLNALANNALLELLYNTIMNNTSTIDVKTIGVAIDIIIEVISSKFVLGFTQIQTSPFSSPVATYNNTSLALDSIVIVLDILQLAIIRFVENLHTDKLNSLPNFTLFGPLERLFANFGEISSSVSCCTDLNNKEIWCQSVKKSSQIIVLLAEINLSTMKKMNDVKGTSSIQGIIQLVSLLQALAPTTMITITISDSNSRFFSALNYWSACCNAMANLEYFLAYSTKKGYIEEIPKTSHEYQLKTIVTSIIGRVINSLSQANFNPKELYAEICRMKHGRNHNIESCKQQTNDDELFHLNPYQIRYILFGLHKMLQVKSFASRILKNPNILKLPRTTEWMTSIAESLMLCISYGPLKLKGDVVYEEHDDQIGKISLKLSPHLAELLLQLCYNYDDFTKIDWIFIELSRYLSEFTDFLRRIRKFSKTARYLHASSASSLPSLGSIESNVDDQQILGDSYDSFYSLANSANPIKGRSPRESSSPLFVERDKPKFSIGDLVDGHCSTQNGSYRWFPGTVKSINSDKTYVILYKDGDEHKNKKESELRLSKRAGSKSRAGLSAPKAQVPPFVPSLAMNSTKNHVTQDSPQCTEALSPKPLSERTSTRSTFLSTPDFNISPMTKYDDKGTDYGFKLNLPTRKEKGDELASPKSVLSDDSDNNIFEIPSVFKDTERSDRSVSFVKNKDIVPRMQFEDLNMSGSFQMPNASQSLSSDLFGGILNELSVEKQLLEKKGNFITNSSRSGDFNYQGTDRSKDDGGSNATRLLSWRDESSRLSGQSTSRLGLLVPRPYQSGPSLEMLSSQEAIQRIKYGQVSGTFPLASSARSSKSVNSCQIPISLSDSFEDLDDHTLSIFNKTFSIISAILINRSISNSLLQYSCCISRETSEFATHPNGERKKVLSNILFSVRDFLDVLSSSDARSMIGQLASMCNMTNRAMMRLLKLTTPLLFQNCLIRHSEKGVRIGQGGFGTINKVICDCAVLKVCQQCCWFREKGSETIRQSQRSVAIKRVSRERSAYENPMFYDIFQEISCLEIISSLSFNGACKLIDYGIVHAEYWIIMECGKCNLKEWRLEYLSRNNSDSFMTTLELRRCLAIFLDALLIIQEVHNNDITHFDLKCENFIVRSHETRDELLSNDEKLNIEYFLNAYSHGSCSGNIFIADFGEAVYQENSISNDRPFKSRGTLPIQSPEMIALTEKSDSTRNGQRVFTKPNKKSDIWSLGCMLYELLTGEYLFYEKSWPELFVNLCMDEMAPLSFDKLEKIISTPNIRAAIESILRSVLKQDAENRITIKELMVDVYDLIQTLYAPSNKMISNDVDEKGPLIDITIPSHEQLNSSLSKSIISTVHIRQHVLDCGAQRLFLRLKSKHQMNESIICEDDNNPELVINKLIKCSSLNHVSQIIVTEKLSNIYKNLDCLYEVNILADDDLATMDNQLKISNNFEALLENVNIVLSKCIANIKQGKVVIINLYSQTEDRSEVDSLEQFSVLQLTVAVSLIEYLSSYRFEKNILRGECKGYNKIQSISPWIHEHCNYDILNFIFANITL